MRFIPSFLLVKKEHKLHTILTTTQQAVNYSHHRVYPYLVSKKQCRKETGKSSQTETKSHRIQCQVDFCRYTMNKWYSKMIL